MTNEDKILKLKSERDQQTNTHLTNMEKEICDAIKYSDVQKLISLGCNEFTNINFMLELNKGEKYPLLLLAASIGHV